MNKPPARQSAIAELIPCKGRRCGAVICTPFVALPAAVEAVRGTNIAGRRAEYALKPAARIPARCRRTCLGAGRFHVIIGHSERRQYFAETNRPSIKVKAALAAGLKPIICVGEQLAERVGHYRRAGGSPDQGGPSKAPADELCNIIIAYEPVWAIGTGKPPPPSRLTR